MHWAVRRLILFREQRFDVIVRGVDCTRPSRFVDVLAAQSWNSTPSEDIIGSTDRRCDRNRIHLGNVGSPEELHKLASKTKQAVGAHTGEKASRHSDYVNDETAKTLPAVELVELETP